jgi:redox-sensitive bicupin YhaK (pirin superfamily)
MARKVVKVVRGMPASDGAGVRLNRIMGQPGLPDLDPFLLLDEFRSDKGSDYVAGFPDHPHRGFETVTYMLAGRMRHGDHMGNVGLLRPGSVQWMTAGRGIVHSEMPEQEDGLLWGFQLWVNLPAKDKMTAPRYQDIDPEKIPMVTGKDGVGNRVVAGKVGEVEGPVQGVATEPLYLDIMMPGGVAYGVRVPPAHTGFVYVFEGEARIGETTLARGDLGVLSTGDDLVELVATDEGARLILVAGKPLKEPVAKYGPFVMNTPQQIKEAIADYQAGKF